MPVVFRAHGLRFVIYVEDHEPPHVHVYGNGEAKIEIGADELPPAMLYSVGMSRSVEKRALRTVLDNQTLLRLRWIEIHG